MMRLPSYTEAEAKQFREYMANWQLLAPRLRNMEDEILVLKLLRFELTFGKRLHMIDRLKARYNKLRDKRERYELLSWTV